jgi:hypothetical protein
MFSILGSSVDESFSRCLSQETKDCFADMNKNSNSSSLSASTSTSSNNSNASLHVSRKPISISLYKRKLICFITCWFVNLTSYRSRDIYDNCLIPLVWILSSASGTLESRGIENRR